MKRISRFFRRLATIALAWLAGAAPAPAQLHSALERKGLEGLESVALALIPDGQVSPLGAKALSLRPADWKHAFTEHFIFHYFESHVASPVAVEAEFYRRVLTRELRLDAAPAGGRSHVFVFDRPVDWQQFQLSAKLDPWTGGIHFGGDLFLLRNAAHKFKNNALGHEIVHLTLFRLYPGGLPLWVEEGLAEFLSIRAHAAFTRARGYDARPTAPALPPDARIGLRSLSTITQYPTDSETLRRFYEQSHLLVRFLWGDDPARFLDLLAKLGRKESIDSALPTTLGASFPNVEALQAAFFAQLRPANPPP